MYGITEHSMFVEVKTGITVEITALKDDMPSVIALLKPVFEEVNFQSPKIGQMSVSRKHMISINVIVLRVETDRQRDKYI